MYMTEHSQPKAVFTEHNLLIFLKKFGITLLIVSPLAIFFGIIYIYQFMMPDAKAPFVQFSGRDPRTEAIIAWETEDKEASAVWYGKNEDDLKSKETDSERVKNHHIILTDLNPDTLYYYRVGIDDSDPIYRSEIYSFKTAPNDTDTEFKFAVYSDSQQFYGLGWHNRICDAISKLSDISFVAFAGDMCQNWDYKPDWNQFFKDTSVYTDKFPFAPCPGNHDSTNPATEEERERYYYEQYFGSINASSNPHTFSYSFNWSNTMFVVAEIARTDQEDPNVDFNANVDVWLKDTLAKGQDKDFRILMFHRQLFSAEEDNDMLIDRIVPIVEDYNVSLVLYGHHHHYERFLYNDRTYLCLGGGGSPQFGANYFRPGKYSECFNVGPSFTTISVSSNKLKITTLTPENDVIESLILKLDEKIAKLEE